MVFNLCCLPNIFYKYPNISFRVNLRFQGHFSIDSPCTKTSCQVNPCGASNAWDSNDSRKILFLYGNGTSRSGWAVHINRFQSHTPLRHSEPPIFNYNNCYQTNNAKNWTLQIGVHSTKNVTRIIMSFIRNLTIKTN